MNSLIIGFSKPKNNKFPILSWIIRLIENASYSHAYIKWHSEYLERDIVYQASGSSVNFIEGKHFNNKAETLYEYEISVSDEAIKIAKQKAMDYCGKPYGIKQIIGIFLVKMSRLLGKNIKNPFSDGNATYICSELVASILNELNIELNIHIDNITPKDIKEFLDKNLEKDSRIIRIK